MKFLVPLFILFLITSTAKSQNLTGFSEASIREFMNKKVSSFSKKAQNDNGFILTYHYDVSSQNRSIAKNPLSAAFYLNKKDICYLCILTFKRDGHLDETLHDLENSPHLVKAADRFLWTDNVDFTEIELKFPDDDTFQLQFKIGH